LIPSGPAGMVWAMSFRRTILGGSLAWLVVISGAHAWLNLELFRTKAAAASGLKISYLPVT
jgi:hypothetical protein